MDSQRFNKIVDEQLDRSRSVLNRKNSAYNPAEDKLKTFKVAAALNGELPRAALAGMMVKHTVSVYDMANSSEVFPMDVWDEKITDHINYLIFLRALVEHENDDEFNVNIAPMQGSLASDEALAELRERLRGEPPVDTMGVSQMVHPENSLKDFGKSDEQLR